MPVSFFGGKEVFTSLRKALFSGFEGFAVLVSALTNKYLFCWPVYNAERLSISPGIGWFCRGLCPWFVGLGGVPVRGGLLLSAKCRASLLDL